ncbi:transposase [Arthrobacter sp. efr-133-TYG-120]|uniref:transposase n=1 Tax=Arthrobacter sp. efr-133-TYG-120 TaxID=3040280 RepID=UPI00254ED676|nr:transposase [Arthrobacter sp. efr-133-TYG-120]
MSVQAVVATDLPVVVAVDVGKTAVALSVTDAGRHRLLGPVDFEMTGRGVEGVLALIRRRLAGADVPVRVGIEAAGHYHRPLLVPSVWPADWQVLAGRGIPVAGGEAVIGELGAWAAHRTRRIQTRTATKNQLLGQLDRAFPGLTLVLPDVLGTKVGRLVAAEFTDPKRLAKLGAGRFVRFAAARGLRVRWPLAERLVQAAREALTTEDAAVAREVLVADLALLAELGAQIDAAETEFARLLPMSPFATLTTTPGWGVVRAGNYGGALGDPHRWPGPAQIYRASGLSPAQYESAGKRRDGSISREGSVALRRALIDLGMGLWFNDPPSRVRAATLKERGKHGGVIACAMAHRANRIAYALVRDHAACDPARWA